MLESTKTNSLQIPLNQPFPIPPGCEPTGPDQKLSGDTQPEPNSQQQSSSSPSSEPQPKFKPRPKSNSGILKSYCHAVFGKGTIVSSAQTHTSLPLSALTMSIDFGSRYESPQIRGLTHFLSQTFLRSTTNRVTGTLHRDMQKLGIKLSAESNREQFIITATTPSSRITPIIGTFFDLALNSAFDLIDIQGDLYDYSWGLQHHIQHNNYLQFQELLHATAFGPATIGLPLYPNDDTVMI